MKSQNKINSTQSSLLKQITNQISIYCSGNNQAFQLCSNDKCKNTNPFTCFHNKCQCKKQHTFCLKGNIHNVLQIINAQIYQNDIKTFIQNLFDQLIDKLSQFRDNLLSQIQKIKSVNLHSVQQKFLKILKNQLSQTQINNKQTAQLWKIASNKHETQFNVFEGLKNTLNAFQIIFNQNLQNIKSNCLIQTAQFGLINKMISKQLILQSKIIKDKQFSQRTINMFRKQIKKLDLIFRASQNQFSTIKFYEKCGNIQSTVFIALTEKGKIFGGYSPFQFNCQTIGYVTDNKKQTFIFSVSQNERFELVDKQLKSIYIQRARQNIYFGSDFYICHKSNITNTNRVGYMSNYNNDKYKNDKQSYLKLNGTQKYQCLILQWQVYHIQFQTQ